LAKKESTFQEDKRLEYH